MKIKLILIFIFLICLQNIYAIDVEITGKEVEGFLNADFNRTLNFIGGISAAGGIELNNRLAFKGGVSLGWAEEVTNIKLFTNAAFRITEDRPLEAKLVWDYDGLPEYEAHAHSIVPVISWNGRIVGISAGLGLRFTSFFGESPLFELLLPMKIYANFINNEKICIGLSFANFNDFSAGSFISLALAAYASFKVSEHWTIISELEYKHSGADGLTSTFHGIVWKGGARFTW
jgi:hypothetical protein